MGIKLIGDEMTQTVKQTKNFIPKEVREKIKAELGTMSDRELAAKYEDEAGVPIDRHTIFWMRKQEGIPAANPKGYTKPKFRGKIEDAHPEITKMIGKVPITAIARHFGVSRSCINDAAKRLGFNRRTANYERTIQEILAE